MLCTSAGFAVEVSVCLSVCLSVCVCLSVMIRNYIKTAYLVEMLSPSDSSNFVVF